MDLHRHLCQKTSTPVMEFHGKTRKSIEKENERLAAQLGTTAKDARDIQMGRAPASLPIETLNGTNGYVYLVRSSSHAKDIYKIGATNKTMQERLKGLNNTSTITPFRVQEAFFVESDPFELERRIHAELAKYRVNKQREFFKYPKSKILDVIKTVCEGGYTSREQFKQAREESLALHKEKQRFEAERLRPWSEAKSRYSTAIHQFDYIHNNPKPRPDYDPLYNYTSNDPAYTYEAEISLLDQLTAQLKADYKIEHAEYVKRNRRERTKFNTIVGAVVLFVIGLVIVR
ncbi:GIY-YIG nuclease family protein [Shewanella atlantica]|nr:GIY-YIG nuclease family protein [Shewanella atlantica]